MLRNRRFLAVGLLATLLLTLTACMGENRESTFTTGAFQVQVNPSRLSIPSGGSGYVTVSATWPLPHALDYQGPLALSLVGAPAGVQATGTLAPDQASATLTLWVDGSVAPQTIPNLQLVASGGGATAEVSFALTIAPPLPPGQLRADLVQASGGLQQGGTLANAPFALEPVAATTASDAAQVEAVRHGFFPAVPSR